MINVDLTTKNTVYNTLGPQAQWIQHRFGRRDYPDIELDADLVHSLLNNNQETVNFLSTFGDPSQHSNILSCVEMVEEGKVVFNSNLSFDDDLLIELLNKKSAYIVVPTFGIQELSDKILLGSNWKLIEKNLKNLNCTVCVEFQVFEHNLYQLPILKDLCNKLQLELKIKPGISLHHKGFSAIVDENKNWLYDVYSCEEHSSSIRWPNLHQTVDGYNSLIQYVKSARGRSILNSPSFYKIDKDIVYDNISISVTGHVFPSFELQQIFSNALCTDWNLSFSNITEDNKITVKEEYIHLCCALTKIIKILKFNNLNEHSYESILSNFANSNI